jgi:SAM-dependent methyltransferase
MRTDVLDYHEFYRTPLGAAALGSISARIVEAWGDARGCRLAGFGFANPYLAKFDEAERRLPLAPGGQGVIRWPSQGPNAAALVGELSWPLPDASIDRLLIIHGLEESPDPRRLMREAWRVLTDDGRIIIVASHRRGLWSIIETTPFAHGRPYLKGQLDRLLREAMFGGTSWNAALYFPPVKSPFLLRSARAWERAGGRVWPGLSGVLMVEASKDLAVPAGLVRSARDYVRRPAAAIARPNSASRKSTQDDKAG